MKQIQLDLIVRIQIQVQLHNIRDSSVVPPSE